MVHVGLIWLLAREQVDDGANVWLLFLLILMSMTQIWMIRQIVVDGTRPSIKQALYKGPAQIVPFAMMTLLALVQLIPFTAGLYLLESVIVFQIVVSAWEILLFVSIFVLLGAISYYWMVTSVVALYIVTLPDITPMTSWHTARNLVEGRRVIVARRLAPVLILIGFVSYFFLLITPDVWSLRYNTFWISLAIVMPLVHIYCYRLYRALV